jgi:hypothetical protein
MPTKVRVSALRHPFAWLVAAVLTALLGGVASAQPTVEYALGLSPFQKNVDFDRVTADQAKSCSIKMEKEGGVNAWVVRGPRGEVLRSFADTNADRVVDRWSYYKDGSEVYRDIDSNHNAKADQARWLNAGGSRWGADEDENGTLDSWKSISAEETTSELVDALRSRDPAVLGRLLPTKADLEAAGFAEPRLSELVGRVAAAAKGFPVLAAAAQKQLGSAAKWNNMLAPQPGVLPAGAAMAARMARSTSDRWCGLAIHGGPSTSRSCPACRVRSPTRSAFSRPAWPTGAGIMGGRKMRNSSRSSRNFATSRASCRPPAPRTARICSANRSASSGRWLPPLMQPRSHSG